MTNDEFIRQVYMCLPNIKVYEHAKKLVAIVEAGIALKKANYRECIYNTGEEYEAFKAADDKFTKAIEDLERE